MQKNGEHIKYKEGRTFKGTQRFSSINNHFGREQGRRDDLESLGYVLIYFLNGSLPWQCKQMQRTSTKDIKNSTTIETLCKGLPKEFEYYMTYVRNLRVDEKPDYLHLTTLFQDLFIKSGFKMDQIYDWLPTTFQQQQRKAPQSTQI